MLFKVPFTHLPLASMPPLLNVCHASRIIHARVRLPARGTKIIAPCQRRSMHPSQRDGWWLPYTYLEKHPDEQAPEIPYVKGSRFSAVAYEPPTSFMQCQSDWYHLAVGQVQDDIKNLPPLEACLRHPPAEGKLKPRSPSVQFRVLEHISVGYFRNSQVVKVELESSTSDISLLTPTSWYTPQAATNVAAKLYDPLYADWTFESKPDPFYNCDAAYSLETQAYRDYLPPLYGDYVAHFLGSYTIDVPIPQNISGKPKLMNGVAPRFRPVRAILYEYTPGVPLSEDMESWTVKYSQAQRKQIMRALITAESKLRQLDVRVDEDFEARNVVIKSVEEDRPADIRIIDFGAAQCGQRAIDEGHVPTLEPEPVAQIIERWRDIPVCSGMDPSNLRYPFADLVDWDWDTWLCNEYAESR